MTTWSARTTYQGRAVNQGTKQILAAANKMLATAEFGSENGDATMVQGGYNAGAVKASAGTHDGGGAFDLTPFNWKNRVKVFRILGCAAWYRPYNWDNRGGGAHIHVIVCGDGTASAGGKSQVGDYLDNENGLANHAKDPNWRPRGLPIYFHLDSDLSVRYTTRTTIMHDSPAALGTPRGTLKKGSKFTPVAKVKNGSNNYWLINANGRCIPEKYTTKTKPTKVPAPKPTPAPAPKPSAVIRPVTFNFPDKTKIKAGTEAERAERSAVLLKKQSPSFIGFNELVGPMKEGLGNPASPTAATMAKALGDRFHMVVPTTSYNENYIAVNRDKTSIIKQFPDVKLYVSGTAGKHVTIVVLQDKVSGLIYVVGQTHLGSDIDTTETQRQAQGQLVYTAVHDVAKKYDNAPVFIQGDMNTPHDVLAFAGAGLQNVRKAAKDTTNSKYSTFVTQKDTSPNVDKGDWIIDQIWVPKGWRVNGYTVVIDGTHSSFVLPRISDHLPIVASVSE